MNFEIIDFHTHPFIEEIDNINRYTANAPMSTESFAKDLTECGISRFAGSVICRRPDYLTAMLDANTHALKLRDIYGGRYIPGIMVDANHVEESKAAIDTARKEGIRLIGELIPTGMGWNFTDEGFREILDYARSGEFVISMHSNEDVENMEMVAKDFPELSFVFAHPGEQKRLTKHISAMKQHKNIYLDLSGTGLFRYGMLKHLVDEVGADRILFGTDHPVCNPAMYVAGVMLEKLTDNEKALIFAQNAKRLLGIQ